MTEYLYRDPTNGRWTRPANRCLSRDAAAHSLIAAYPHMRGGNTAPVFNEINGVPLIEQNSIVHFTAPDGGTLWHNPSDLAAARIK